MSDHEPAATPAPRVPLWNIANILTMSRLVMVPLFVWLMFLDGSWWRFAAFAVFVLAAITDRVDGELARRHNLVTDFGKIADPIADKALTGAALVVLSLQGDLWWWVTIAILVREWGVTALRFAVLRYVVMPASQGGKLKTVLQIVAISVYLFPLQVLPLSGVLTWFAHVAMGAALAITLWTGLTYVRDAVRAVRARGGHTE
ncbi:MULTISPECIES: CDP-diacylglycerol--glycerol-3-phosphate 3-phosphatidyltransferase [Nocardiopsis]|jgi:CDP-diacylglycerol--glycerol-3-phosphate 3-phosphatidyltransferase|uniref:CDP-diacylglycerol--glycerol-3-phosphate 3-phosphatidyltransferase n=1 Tax=Nocardiopsis sinuspersici TaxID=501010 RepID=A0A1V3BXW1_9ACTN|nr:MULTISPECIES: CDP-diacylglycerol--glycerol-3-phosphate 3-phosphatidyltransferase [Nocardiopsis]NYH54116.1 CDP-diacylglycerol--glycerol-3-phosphate 3-phosphatidyltransferase [Nocardiopsis sinuspersici]OOC52950.1 CDP-diacylglycerol--glycerol-3-phosphate 3-phosphatidyltransferase [Nocardiopsis sinuspersici]